MDTFNQINIINNINELNKKHLQIMIDMEEPNDYNKYREICKNENITELPIIMWANRLGNFLVGKKMYPELSLEESFIKMTTNNKIENPNHYLKPLESNCSSCGGGKTL